MKKSILLRIWITLIGLLLLLSVSKAQGGGDSGNSIQIMSDGGYIIVGSTSYGAGGSAIYVVRTDSLGNKIWSKAIGQTSPDYGYSIAKSGDGGFVIVGNTSGLGTDVYLIKIDSNGNLQWSKVMGGNSGDGANCVQRCSDGGFIITGGTNSFFSTSLFGSDILLIKTDIVGNLEWAKIFGGNIGDIGYSVYQCSDGGFILAGQTLTDYDAIGAPGSIEGVILLIKTDSIGNMEWSKTYVQDDGDIAYSVQQTADGGFIITGDGYSSFSKRIFLIKTDGLGNVEWTKKYNNSDSYANAVKQCDDDGFVIVGRDFNSSSGMESEVYLLRTNKNGSLLWSKTFGGTSVDVGRDVQQTNDKGFIITGSSSSFGGGNSHLYLLKTDSMGSLEWSNTYGDVAGKTGTGPPENDEDNTDEFLFWPDINSPQDADCYTDITDSLIFSTPVTIVSTPLDSSAPAATTITSGGTFVGIPVFLDSVYCGTSIGTADIGFENVKYNLTNYPNPFGSATTIKYNIPVKAKEAVIVIYDIITNSIVKSLILDNTGHSKVVFRSDELPAGTYLYALKIDGTVVSSRKMLIVK